MNARVLSFPIACAALMTTCTTANAQWSLDPADPMVLCNAANGQTGLKAISDGNGGWFAFWTDKRTDGTHAELYGQHLDEAGNALWTANGQLFASIADSTVDECAPTLMADGSVILAYIYSNGQGYNGVIKAQRLDENGNSLWTAPVEIARSGQGPLGNIFGFGSIRGLRIADEAYLAWFYTPQGGNGSYAWERVQLDGTTRFGSPCSAVPSSGWGPFSIRHDGARGLVFDWRQGNGAGAPLQAMRVDSSGTNVWDAQLTVSTGTNGLSYAYTTTGDAGSGYFSAWTTSADLGMARYDTSGTFLWTPTPFYACTESHGQDNPKVLFHDGHYFVGWGDNRPPASNQDMYVQKFDMSGMPQWTTDGVLALQFNTYIPNTDLVSSDDGAVIATFDGTVTGFCARKVLSDGTLDWSGPVAFCVPSFNPFYELRVVLADGEGGVVAFWQTFGGDLHAARIYANGDLGDHTGISEEAAAGVSVQPNPARDRITITFNHDLRNAHLSLLSADGRLMDTRVITSVGTSTTLDVGSLDAGCYVLRIDGANGSSTQRFIKN
jgi:hypothetical protein